MPDTAIFSEYQYENEPDILFYTVICAAGDLKSIYSL